MIISKKEFSRICKVSTVTIYKWIEDDKNGLKAYVTDKGIDDSIFEKDEWKQYKTDPETLSEAENVSKLKETIGTLEKRKDELEGLVTFLTNQIELKDKQIEEQTKQISYFMTILKAEPASLNAPQTPDPAAAPEQKPRKSFFEFLGFRRK